jgi:hypothetical protein
MKRTGLELKFTVGELPNPDVARFLTKTADGK